MTKVSLTVNGSLLSAEVEPRTHLADLLRETHNLTGTHIGCEHGVCGACTLLVDGVPIRSCITFAVACENAKVTTIEGLDEDEIARELRAAFTAHHALQCGYCTPGMIVSARDIVLRMEASSDLRLRRPRHQIKRRLRNLRSRVEAALPQILNLARDEADVKQNSRSGNLVSSDTSNSGKLVAHRWKCKTHWRWPCLDAIIRHIGENDAASLDAIISRIEESLNVTSAPTRPAGRRPAIGNQTTKIPPVLWAAALPRHRFSGSTKLTAFDRKQIYPKQTDAVRHQTDAVRRWRPAGPNALHTIRHRHRQPTSERDVARHRRPASERGAARHRRPAAASQRDAVRYWRPAILCEFACHSRRGHGRTARHQQGRNARIDDTTERVQAASTEGH